MSRSVTVTAPKMVVFEYLKHLKNKEEYGVWNNIDPDMKKSYNGADGEVGFTYTWDSQNEDVGAGEQEIVAINDALEDAPELVNNTPFSDGWMIEVKLDNSSELDALMDKDAYLSTLKG